MDSYMEACADLAIAPGGRHIVKKDGSPFFWLGDTAWELFHRLNREEAAEYLATRARQRFNVIQAVALSEFDGLATPNAYGRAPLLKNAYGLFDPRLPDIGAMGNASVAGDTGANGSTNGASGAYSYWDHVDYIIGTAGSLGLYIGLLPTWGDKYNIGHGKGPEIFTPKNAYAYGKWIGRRYRERSNIIWIMGGDRPLENDMHRAIVRQMAAGVREATGGRHLITFHPSGASSSSKYVHGEAWLDFNMIQSGHGGVNIPNYEYLRHDRALVPTKPTLDGEPRYEDHPIGFNPDNGYFDDYDVRVAAYWSTLSGACGHTYGHHSIWSFNTERKAYMPLVWREALHRPGAEQMRHLRDLLTASDFAGLVPCQELVSQNYGGANHISAAKGARRACLYTPNGLDVTVNLGAFGWEAAAAFWFDPRNGSYTYAGAVGIAGCASADTASASPADGGTAVFSPPSRGRNNDWVLVIEHVKAQ